MGVVDIRQERDDQAQFLDDLFKNNASLKSCFRNGAGKCYFLSARHAKKLCAEGLREGIAKFKGKDYFLDGLYKCSFEDFSAYAGLQYHVKSESSHPVLESVSEKLRRDDRLSSLWKKDNSSGSFPRQISKMVYYSFLEYVKPIWEAYKLALIQKAQEVPEQKTQPL